MWSDELSGLKRFGYHLKKNFLFFTPITLGILVPVLASEAVMVCMLFFSNISFLYVS
jgi:hypothetical protein